MLRPGWYVLLYHEVSWEEPPALRGIGGMTVPPDRFEEHLAVLEDAGRLCSPDEAMERMARAGEQSGGKAGSASLDEPLISLWFDDGYTGVRRYAAPAMARRELTATISICSRFALRQEMYWRCQLGTLAASDGLRFLRSRMRKLGVDPGASVKDTTMDAFTPELRDAVEKAYRKHLPEEARLDAFRIFDTVDGLRALADTGWTLANHSAAHWPIGERAAIEHLEAQFTECEEACAKAGLKLSDDWVLPFDRQRADELELEFRRVAPERRLVLVGNQVNRADTLERRVISRIVAPPVSGNELIARMKRAAG
ncbi:hypothetical protein ABI59_08155 [Acidobacteria bacterium Mor1]|nr:hypothetical protein ABI59_08155 [Acidobacteria bacterium Mor1]